MRHHYVIAEHFNKVGIRLALNYTCGMCYTDFLNYEKNAIPVLSSTAQNIDPKKYMLRFVEITWKIVRTCIGYKKNTYLNTYIYSNSMSTYPKSLSIDFYSYCIFGFYLAQHIFQ